jgi:hypothetical protein
MALPTLSPCGCDILAHFFGLHLCIVLEDLEGQGQIHHPFRGWNSL